MKGTDTRLLNFFAGAFDIRLGAGTDRVEQAAENIRLRWPDVVPDVGEDEEIRRLKKMVLCHRSDDWTDAKLSDVLIAARAAFHSDRIEKVVLDPLRDFLIHDLCEDTHPAVFKVMFDVYQSSYIPNAPHTKKLAKRLGIVKSKLGLREKNVLDAVPDLLDGKEAPLRIARKLLVQEDLQLTLVNWGLRETYDKGLMHHLFLSVVRECKPELATGRMDYLNRFLAWLSPKNSEAKQNGAGAAIDALLVPWVKSSPSADYQAALVSGLVELYGDPRLRPKAAWSEASKDSIALIRRWLTGETMQVFLDAISKTNSSHMWQPRREFWMGLYEKNVIDEAWVAFSRKAHRAALHMASSASERNFYNSFGREVRRPDTSLLIMRIGNRVIVEGSHSYKVQLFEAANPKKPVLYQPTYDCEVIRLSSDLDKPHSTGGSWQSWVERQIR